jgi:uncharacterized membrane protein YgdD (TMEM256/DUF423 family)
MAGAFGSHGLKGRANMTPDLIKSWETASHYALFNGVALLAVSMHPRFGRHAWAGPLIAAGTVVFSGSIMGLVLDREKKCDHKALGRVVFVCADFCLLFPPKVSFPGPDHPSRRRRHDCRVRLSPSKLH